MVLVFLLNKVKNKQTILSMKINYQKVAEREPNKGFSRCYKLSRIYMMVLFLQKKDTKRRVQLPPEPPDKKPRDLATPGFRLRHQNPLVKIERGSRESLVTDINDIEMTSENDVTEKRMKQILGRMYNDKKYLEQLVEQAGKTTNVIL